MLNSADATCAGRAVFARRRRAVARIRTGTAAPLLALCAFVGYASAAALAAQDTSTAVPAAATDVSTDRLAALQREATDLARQARTLLGELRQLELQRDTQVLRATAADAAVAQANAALAQSTARLRTLEQTRLEQAPDLERRLVDLYKHGRRGYALRLAAAGNARDFARALRVVSSLAFTTERRLAERQQTLDAMRKEQGERRSQLERLQAAQGEAHAARVAADRAVSSRQTLLQNIDQRRDLAAQLSGELQAAGERLRAQISSLESRETASAAVPAPPVLARGTLNWPVPGRVTTVFGEGANRPGQFAVRNGIEIAAAAGAPVLALADGTVAYAEPFVGFGTLVIVDHGGRSYSLYGYLQSAKVVRGARVVAGAEVGQVGAAPAGAPTLYLEVRVDGRAVDPVQWLKPRS